MNQRSYALDGAGVVHVLLPPLPGNWGEPQDLRAMCNAVPLLVVEGPVLCMACVIIDADVERTAEYINGQLRHLVGQPVNGDTLGEIAARLLRPMK